MIRLSDEGRKGSHTLLLQQTITLVDTEFVQEIDFGTPKVLEVVPAEEDHEEGGHSNAKPPWKVGNLVAHSCFNDWQELQAGETDREHRQE